jgi:PKD repeat protein
MTPTVGPLADFWATPLRGTAPLTVTFVNNSANATTYLWDFGDGAPSIINYQLSITHTYTQAGIFTITLAASDGVVTDTLSRAGYIRAFDPNEPQADFTASPLSGTTPLTVTFFMGFWRRRAFHYQLSITNYPHLHPGRSLYHHPGCRRWGNDRCAGQARLYYCLAGVERQRVAVMSGDENCYSTTRYLTSHLLELT